MWVMEYLCFTTLDSIRTHYELDRRTMRQFKKKRKDKIESK